MKVAIRDDDTSFFTTPDAHLVSLDARNGRVKWDVVIADAAKGYWSTNAPLVIRDHLIVGVSGDFDNLPGILKTIALHGCTHQDYPDGYEFEAAPDLDERVQRGRAYLESLLECRISLFVPPHNALSKRGLAAVSSAGMNILGSFLSFRPSMRPWEPRMLANWWAVQRYRRATGRHRRDPLVYPRVLRYSKHAEFGCHSLVPGTTADALVRAMTEAQRADGDFCLATHYWEIDGALERVMRAVLEFAARQPHVRFVAAEELFA